jgi:hypothetical protein
LDVRFPTGAANRPFDLDVQTPDQALPATFGRVLARVAGRAAANVRLAPSEPLSPHRRTYQIPSTATGCRPANLTGVDFLSPDYPPTPIRIHAPTLTTAPTREAAKLTPSLSSQRQPRSGTVGVPQLWKGWRSVSLAHAGQV